MSERIRYFGFGANREASMIEAITGTPSRELVGTPAVLRSYGIAVQAIGDIPDTIERDSQNLESQRERLSALRGADYIGHVLFPRVRWNNGLVLGTAWDLSKDDYERVRYFDLAGGVFRETHGLAVTELGEQAKPELAGINGLSPLEKVVTVAMHDNQSYGREVDGLRYSSWILPAEDHLVLAEQSRKLYNETQRSPSRV